MRPNGNIALSIPEHVPQLDGLRGLAILAVIAYHAESAMKSLGLYGVSKYGWSGVDLFFVLSGFLITRILLKERDRPGASAREYFGRFYVRRALRIWPLYYAFLFVIVVFGHRYFSELEALHTTHPWHFYALYIQNLVFYGLFPLQFTWSLAVEEQFYIVWPALVRFTSPKFLMYAAVAGLLVAPLARHWAFAAGFSKDAVTVFPVTRLDGLLWGSLVASVLQERRLSRRELQILAVTAVSMAAVVYVLPLDRMISKFSAFAMAYAALLLFALTASPSGVIQRVLCVRWLRYTGKVSYCIYLVHLAVMAIVEATLRKRLHLLELGESAAELAILSVQLVAIYLVATVSWRFFEEPILRLKRYFPYSTVGEAGGVSRLSS